MGMTIRKHRVTSGCAGALVMLFACGAARADSTDLDWLGIIYLWAADIGVDFRDRRATVAFSDIVDKIEMGFQGHVEAQGDTMGGFVDVSYMSVSDSSTQGPVRLRGNVDMTAMDLAMVWSPGERRMTGTEVYAGLRYISTEAGLRIEPVAAPEEPLRVGLDTNYTDILAGARYIAPLSDHWTLTVMGDLSTGDTEGTWSLAGYGIYRTGRHHFIAGYKHFDMEFEAGRGNKRATQTYSGPLVAYGFSF